MLFIIINCIVKLSFWKWQQSAIFGIVCGLFLILMYPYAIQQSKVQIANFLNNTNVMQDASVGVTIESGLCFFFCFMSLIKIYGKNSKKRIQLLFWYPGVLIFPVLFYILTQAIFSFTGIDFPIIAYILAIIVSVMIPLLSYGCRKILPEKELRLEIHFLMSLIVCILGLTATVDGDIIYTASEEPLNIKAIILSLGLFVIAFFLGFFGNKIKWIIKQKNNIKRL
ncbi:MAG: hypothetical protein LBQ84_05595 [Flavobacteriaceae bacterium]|nr:hypothetical protein [Flavobacteriaceae bacterium]